MDRLLAESSGVWLEPQFRGDAPPALGSNEHDFSAYYVVHLPRGSSVDAAVQRFRGLPDVVDAHPIGLAPVVAVPNDSLWSLAYYFYQPSRRDIHALEAWDLTRGDTSEVVAIIDTGVLPYHPDIGGTESGSRGQIWTNWPEAHGVPGVDDDLNGFVDDDHGWDFMRLESGFDAVPGEDWQDADNDPNDFIGHGTCVAGLVGAINDNQIGVTGTAWNVRLMPLRVAWSSPRQQVGIVNMSYVASAVRYATHMGATVINISLATTPEIELDVAIDAALDSNIVVVVAAGNNNTPNYISERFPDLIVVGATDNEDVVPIWSSKKSYVDLSAPGVNLATTVLARLGSDSLSLRTPSYVPDASGTSFSTPIVSGAVASMLAARRARGIEDLSPRQLGTLLRTTTDDISGQNPGLTGFGTGRLNMAHAVIAASRVRAVSPGATTIGPGVVFRTNRGEHLVAFAGSNGRLLVLDAKSLSRIASPLLGGVSTGGLSAADLGWNRGLGIFASVGYQIAGLGAGLSPLPGWPVIVPSGGFLGIPVLGDLDGDGSLEVVSAGTGGRIWAWSATGTLYNGFPLELGQNSNVYAPLALSDLDGQPGVEIIAAQSDGKIHAFRWNGEQPAGWPVLTNDPLPAGPVVSSLAGQPLVVVSGSRSIHRILSDGTELSPISRIAQELSTDPALGDLDGDGTDDIVVAASAGIQATALTGSALPGWPHFGNHPIVGPPLIAYFAPSDTQAVALIAGVDLLGLKGSGSSVPELFAYPNGTTDQVLTTIALDDTVRLVQGTAADGTLYAYDHPAAVPPMKEHAWPAPRGNFARTGSRLYQPQAHEGDAVPPNEVVDLRAVPFGGTGSTRLTWTAPHDLGPAGKAAEYDIRYASTAGELVEGFAFARKLEPTIVPRVPGRPESLLVSGLRASFRYFAIRSRDLSGNWSAASSPAYRQGVDPFDRGASLSVDRNPSGVPFSLRWQTPGAQGMSGRSIRIHDITGRLIRDLPIDGDWFGTLVWDGKDRQGDFVSSGVYVATLFAGPTRSTARFVLLMR